MWPRRLIDLFKIEVPIIQAPMAGAMDWELVAAVSSAGGLGSLPCAMLGPDQIREQVKKIRVQTPKPINLNFFCHRTAVPSDSREAAWRERLAPYYRKMEIDPAAPIPTRNLLPFNAGPCAVVEDLKPEVVSFHFGLPEPALLDRVKAAGCLVASSATTTAEAKWLEKHGADAVIAQGLEAGGHRGMFLTEGVATQVGALALVPQIADAVKVPVIAAGGIADARGIAAAFALGAAGVQIGTAYLFWESKISAVHGSALAAAQDDGTALTNLMSGRPARAVVNRLMREVGPLSTLPPEFPLSAGALAPLRAKAEGQGSGDFSAMWAGQAASLGRPLPAAELTRKLAVGTLEVFWPLASSAAVRRFGSFQGKSGRSQRMLETTRMTQLGSRVCIATIKTMLVYSLSLAPLASFNRWRGWNTAGAFHRRTRRAI